MADSPTPITAESLAFRPEPEKAVALYDAYLAAYAITLSGASLDPQRVHGWQETAAILAAVIGVEDGRARNRRRKGEVIAAIGEALIP